MAGDETTPLLPGARANAKSPPNTKHAGIASALRKAFDIEKRLLFAGFLISLSFSFTQVPIFYAFHLMECDIYYSMHPPYTGTGDRCSRNEIAAGTARDFSTLGMSTTFCGTFNLFVSAWTVKKVGPRLALMLQVFVPAIRVSTQILGLQAGGKAGINIFQCTQLITIVGGPAGYILVVNTIAGELVPPARRTAIFGMLQGCIMLGQATGYLAGGIIGDVWGIRSPFEVACSSFLLATLYVFLALPFMAPETLSDGKRANVQGITGLFTPLRVMVPQTLALRSGKIKKHYGVLFLCAGVFLGVLATGYAPLLIQMYATAEFEFRQSDNGWLMFGFAFMRALFLILLFPAIIAGGRRRYLGRLADDDTAAGHGSGEECVGHFPTRPEELEAPMGTYADEEPVVVADEVEDEGTAFDLLFLRWSLVVDGALTMLTAFATKKWHIYLATFLLPFASGTAPAAKGVMTEMCPSYQRTDALSALTLVENIARLSTQGLFGFVFSALATVGKSYLTFFCNAAIALLAAAVLLLSQFSPEGSQIVETGVTDEDDEPDESPTPDESTPLSGQTEQG